MNIYKVWNIGKHKVQHVVASSRFVVQLRSEIVTINSKNEISLAPVVFSGEFQGMCGILKSPTRI